MTPEAQRLAAFLAAHTPTPEPPNEDKSACPCGYRYPCDDPYCPLLSDDEEDTRDG